MWFPTDNVTSSTQNTPRAERRLPKIERPGGHSGWNSDISKVSKTSKGSKERGGKGGTTPRGAQKAAGEKGAAPPQGDKPFFVEDDRRSKITVVSLKSARTSRTVQTAQSSLATRPIKEKDEPRGAMQRAKKKIQTSLRYVFIATVRVRRPILI